MAKKTVSKRDAKKKDSFEYNFFLSCYTNEISPLPLIKILSQPPKNGEKWKTYLFYEDPELEYFDVYLQNEYYQKEGTPSKIIFKECLLTIPILNCFEETLSSYETMSSITLYNSKLDLNEIFILYNILKLNKNITDLNISNNPLQRQVFFILLRDNNLKYLSIQHCRINKIGMKNISNELKSNKELVFLDLSCNRINDDGLKNLTDALRVNRTLTSLFLIDNWITDIGLEYLMTALSYFELNEDEIYLKRQKKFKLAFEKLQVDKTLNSQGSLRKTKLKNRIGNKSDKSIVSNKTICTTKSNLEQNLSKHNHPFINDSVEENGSIYCKGNNKISFINIAYNNITEKGFTIIKKTLLYQIDSYGPNVGLTNIVLTGNKVSFLYLEEIHKLLDEKNTMDVIDYKNIEQLIEN